MLIHDDLTKGPFLGFPGKSGKGEVDFHFRYLEKPRGDGDVVFSKPSIL